MYQTKKQDKKQMAYSISDDQIIQEVTTASLTHPQFCKTENKENILITLSEFYAGYDKLDPAVDLINWSVVSASEYEVAQSKFLNYDIEDQTWVFFDKDNAQVVVYKFEETCKKMSVSQLLEVSETEYTRNEIYKGLLLHSATNPDFNQPIGNICDRSGWSKIKLNKAFGHFPEIKTATDMTEDRCWEIYQQSKKSALYAAQS